MRLAEPAFIDDLPALAPVIAHEATANGWRGLTREGDVFDVYSGEGTVQPPDSLRVMRNGQLVGRREVRNDLVGLSIGDYLAHIDLAMSLYRLNKCEEALAEIDLLIAAAPTTRAKFNRALILLSLGRWREGLAGHELRLDLVTPPLCAEMDRQGVRRWRGEDLRGKKLLLVHDAGFGDTIAMLRYGPVLMDMGADVYLRVPPQLERLAAQVAPLASGAAGADLYCPMLSLLHLLEQTPEMIPGVPYLAADRKLQAHHRQRIGRTNRTIGIAWSVGKHIEGDYPRSIPIEQLVDAIRAREPEVQIFSIQMQGSQEARALGVQTTTFTDFADCAALVSMMDEIVSVDTAAVHVAGAIGHQNATVLLSHWASWRWRNNPFYPGLRVCRQASPGDWASALALI